MRVLVYVEGRSDVHAMEEHLRALIERRASEGVAIEFLETSDGHRKRSVVHRVPVRAAAIIANDPAAIVCALPDLYPPVDGLRTLDQLQEDMFLRLRKKLEQHGKGNDERLVQRFHVFCFKHDLEALILASEEALAQRLGVQRIEASWTVPVENQNHDEPPKYVVEKLFKEHGQNYRGTTDAPLILSRSDLSTTRSRCLQCFEPFVRFLEEVVPYVPEAPVASEDPDEASAP